MKKGERECITCNITRNEGEREKEEREGEQTMHTFSMKTSLFVILLEAVSESCTMPITGRLLCGVMILRGTISNS